MARSLKGLVSELPHAARCTHQNGADLGNIIDDSDPDIATGWARLPGQVRKHSWVGPRSNEVDMLALAAGLFVEGTLEAVYLRRM